MNDKNECFCGGVDVEDTCICDICNIKEKNTMSEKERKTSIMF